VGGIAKNLLSRDRQCARIGKKRERSEKTEGAGGVKKKLCYAGTGRGKAKSHREGHQSVSINKKILAEGQKGRQISTWEPNKPVQSKTEA